MGAVHASAWMTTGAKLVGVMSKNQASARHLAGTFAIRQYDNYAKLLEQIDLIDICVPTDLHKDMVIEAARAGKHIVCEKPLALNLADAEAMITACQQAGVRLFNALVVRFFPQYRAARDAVVAGQLGRLGVIRLKRAGYPPTGDENWFQREERSGGMVMDLMIHDFDYARWLAGEVERVYAKSIRSSQADSPIDYAFVTLQFKSGAMALIEGGWAYPPGFFRTSLDIAGSDGLIEWNSDDAQTIKPFLKTPDDQTVARVAVPSSILVEDPYSTEIKHAFDAINNHKAFLVTAEDGLEALRIALAAKDSLKTGRAVTL
jgi:predicted dehydrogenase